MTNRANNNLYQDNDKDAAPKLVVSETPVEWSSYLLPFFIGFGFGCGVSVILAHVG